MSILRKLVSMVAVKRSLGEGRGRRGSSLAPASAITAPAQLGPSEDLPDWAPSTRSSRGRRVFRLLNRNHHHRRQFCQSARQPFFRSTPPHVLCPIAQPQSPRTEISTSTNTPYTSAITNMASTVFVPLSLPPSQQMQRIRSLVFQQSLSHTSPRTWTLRPSSSFPSSTGGFTNT